MVGSRVTEESLQRVGSGAPCPSGTSLGPGQHGPVVMELRAGSYTYSNSLFLINKEFKAHEVTLWYLAENVGNGDKSIDLNPSPVTYMHRGLGSGSHL